MLYTSHVVVAVMGVTGAGKSSFIQRVTGRNDIHIENSLSSGTEEVKAYDFTHGSIKFTLVDTPGFDDSRNSDRVVVGKILAWLHKSYCEATQLNGLIFIHPISNPKMGGTALSNLRMFRQLCGPDCLKNVVLATTFWGSVNEVTGKRRERELIENDQFWGKMIAKGSRVVRLDETRASNLKVLIEIARNNSKVVVEAQKEMSAGKSANETSAAQEVDREWKQWKLEKEQKAAAEKQKQQAELEKKERAHRLYLIRLQMEAEQQLHEAQQKAAAEERENERARVRLLAEVKRQEQREREKQERRERQALEAVRAERRAQERRLQESKQEFYKNWTCSRRPYKRLHCDRCGDLIHTDSHYYHCCFCYDDNYDHCLSCSNQCNDPDHPAMKFEKTLESDCTVM